MQDSRDTAKELAGLELFGSLDAGELARAAELLEPVSAEAMTELVREGEHDPDLFLLTHGEVRVERIDAASPGATDELATVGPGSILGEMALLSDTDASASVVASTNVRGYVCRADRFDELMDLADLEDRVRDIAERREAGNWAAAFEPVPVTLADASTILIRPIRLDDHDNLRAFDERLSSESRRSRFLHAYRLTTSMVRYLVEIDQRDHFAWVAIDPEDENRFIAVGRYVRLRDQPDRAEFAMAVADEAHGRGIGSLLLDALGSVATERGIRQFVAHVLWENDAMRAMLRRRDAKIVPDEPGSLFAVMDTPQLSNADLREVLLAPLL